MPSIDLKMAADDDDDGCQLHEADKKMARFDLQGRRGETGSNKNRSGPEINYSVVSQLVKPGMLSNHQEQTQARRERENQGTTTVGKGKR